MDRLAGRDAHPKLPNYRDTCRRRAAQPHPHRIPRRNRPRTITDCFPRPPPSRKHFCGRHMWISGWQPHTSSTHRGMTVRSDSLCSDADVRASRSLAMSSGRCGRGGVEGGANSRRGSVAELGTLVPDGAVRSRPVSRRDASQRRRRRGSVSFRPCQRECDRVVAPLSCAAVRQSARSHVPMTCESTQCSSRGISSKARTPTLPKAWIRTLKAGAVSPAPAAAIQ